MNRPYLIEFPVIGDAKIGFISVADYKQSIPFEVKRVFWTYETPEHIVRGRHAHYQTQQVLLAVSGRILVTTELPTGEIEVFSLEKPHIGVYLPPNVWHTIQYSKGAVQMVMASTSFNEKDYIRDYSDFKAIWRKD